MLGLYRRLFCKPFSRPATPPARRGHSRFVPGLTALDERAVPTATQLYQESFGFGDYAGVAYGPDDGYLKLTVTVTADEPGYEGKYFWDYHVDNVSFDDQSDVPGYHAIAFGDWSAQNRPTWGSFAGDDAGTSEPDLLGLSYGQWVVLPPPLGYA